MQLKEFVEKFVCPNSLIKLWIQAEGGHKMLFEKNKNVCMDWQLLKEEDIWQKKYLENEVIGVNDIFCDDFHREAINIVIKD